MRKVDWKVALVAVLVLVGMNVMANEGLAAQKVRFAIAWLFGGENAHWLVAKEKGYFGAQGLDVGIIRGYGSADGVKRVMSKERDMALVAVPAVVLARVKGIPVKVLGIDFESEPLSLYSLKRSGIKTLKDLEGRSIATHPFGIDPLLLPVMLRINGVDISKVRLVKVQPAQGTPLLIAGKVDALTAFIVRKPAIGAKAGPLGGLNVMRFSDLGVDLYSNSLVATEGYIKSNPDTIRRFVRAWLKGVRYSRNHPEEVINILLKLNPALNRALHRAKWDIASNELIFTPGAAKHGLGYIDPEKMRKTRDIVLRAYNIKTPVKLEDLYTNEFLK